MLETSSQPSFVALAIAAREQSKLGPEAALAAWEDVRARFPQEPLGHAESIVALDRLGRHPEAEQLAAEALEIFPHSQRIAVEYGWLAHHRGDWPEARRRWSRLRERFPDAFEVYFGGGATLRALRRFDEAEVLYAEGIARWPEHALFADHAACAEEAGNLAEAVHRYAELDRRYPSSLAGLLGQARALCAVGRVAEGEDRFVTLLQRFPGHPAALLGFARIAAARGDPAQALERWQKLIEARPDFAEAHAGLAHALNDLNRHAEAEAAADQARALRPDLADAAWLHAQIAHNRGDFPAAIDRWALFRARFPDQSSGYTCGLWSLLGLGRQADAAALMDEAIERFPGNLEVARDWARIPHHVQDWPEAERRWQVLRERFPEEVSVLAGLADVLARLGKWDEGERLLADQVMRGDDFEILCAWAECASHRRDWLEAEARWRRLTAQYPAQVWAWTRLGGTLRDAGRFDDSDMVLMAAIARFGALREFKLQLALTKTSRRDWPGALQLWAELKRDHSGDNDVQIGITHALEQARQDLGAAVGEGRIPFVIPAILEEPADDGASLRTLFLKFEALGGTCEFGMVQRRYGAEPISLLRWASTDPPELITALETGFSGVGEPGHTVVEINNDEYATRDDRYFMFTHTFIRATSAPVAEFTGQHLKRMQFMRRKLLHDLATSTKIFVCTGDFGADEEDAGRILAAMRHYGSGTGLFCVRLADAGHPGGTVERRRRGFYMGYIDRFSTKDINYPAWLELCRKADALRSAETAR